MKQVEDIVIQRLENLKQVVILNHLEKINFDKTKTFYDIMMESVFHGDFDHSFLSKSLMNVSVDDKKKYFELGRKYKDLCFYLGDFHYWADSIEGVYVKDFDLVSMKLLDHYDFLLGLAKDGGEEVLQLLMSLRNSFENDETLVYFLQEMAKKDGKFKDLNNDQKCILCTYPKGVLYEIGEEDKIEEVPTSLLVQNLEKAYSNKLSSISQDFRDLRGLLSNNQRFEEAVLKLYQANN